MATFASFPRATSSQFRQWDPSSLKRTNSKSKAKIIGQSLRRDRTEGATHHLGLLRQDTEDDLHAVPRRTPQVQTTGHIADVEEVDSAMCDLFGADHGMNMYDLASGDDHYQFGRELLDERGIDDATRVATLDSATNGSLDGSSREFHSIGENDAGGEHHSATHVQSSNRASDHQENGYHPTNGSEGGQFRQRGDLDAAVEHAFSVGDIEIPCHGEQYPISERNHVDTVKERSPADDETFFGIVGVTNGPSATRERSRPSSVVDATTITPVAAPDVIPDLEPEDAHPAKRQRRPMLEPASTSKSTSLLNLSGQASHPRASDGPIPGPRAAGRKDDGAVSLVLPPSDLRDEEDDHDAHVLFSALQSEGNHKGTVDELLQSRRSISPFEGMEGEQDVVRDAERRGMNRQGSVGKVGETFEDEFSHNEGFGMPPAKPRRRVGRDWAPKRKRGLLNTALRLLDCNTVPTRQQQVRPSQPRQKPMPGRARIDKGPQFCSPRSSSPGTTAGDGTNINYRPSLDMSCQITDLTLCAVPNGSSIMAATVRYRDSNRSLDPVTLGHKFFGEQGKVIRITQLSPGSWMLLGYRCDDGALGLRNRGGLNAEWMSSPHSDAASHETDHSDHDWDKEGDYEEQGIDNYNQGTRKPWLESDEVLLLSLRDKQGMEWKEICKRFPGRSPGAVQVRYYTLRKKDL